MGTTNCRKFRLLLWKNCILQKRHPVQTIVQIFMPVFFVLLLVLIRFQNNPEIHDQKIYPAWSPMNITETRIFLNLVSTAMNKSLPPFFVYYSPKNQKTEEIVERILLPSFLTFSDPGVANLSLSLKVKGFSSESELVARYKAQKELLLGAIVFKQIGPPTFEYKLRFPSTIHLQAVNSSEKETRIMKHEWYTDLLYPPVQRAGARESKDIYGGAPDYHRQGFLFLQLALDASLIYYTNKSVKVDADSIGGNEIFLRRFPYPKFVDDFLLKALESTLPLIFMLSFIYPVISTTRNIVIEKEKRLKESMKMMGLPNYLHWAAWFVKSLIFLSITTYIIVFFLTIKIKHGLAIVTYADSSILLLFLMAYVLSAIGLSFLMSTLFSKANSAAAGAGLIWFFTYLPLGFVTRRYDQLTLWLKILSCFMCNTGMGLGFQVLIRFEGRGGVKWATLAKGTSPQDDFCLLYVILLLLLDAVLYFFAAIYIEAVWPGEYGVRLKWYFPVTKSYWVGESAVASTGEENAIGNIGGENEKFFEPGPPDAKAGIRIKGLTKRFKKKVAVNNLSFEMYENQITALLGHNGAGKTTTMSMLTGLFPPTSGTAVINGFDIRSNIQKVRDSLGLCPQHNVLFDELTVEEHLKFFSVLKGCEDVRTEINRMVKTLGLEQKRKSKSKTLSGGMQRKLSVGIALVGGSKVVLLDEPTSGMDPGARRIIWDLLSSEKKGRTLVLSTHFMDEADVLGDRIAIMADGQLQTIGSSLFLKKAFGGGYHLVIVKKEGCDPAEITALVQSYIEDLDVDQDIGTELSYSLPEDKVSVFANLFEELEERKEELHIDSYGASMTNMEEVFIRAGKAEAEKKATTAVGSHDTTESVHQRNFKINDDLVIYSGAALLRQQLCAMLSKKLLCMCRTKLLLLFQALAPVVILALSLLILKSTPDPSESPSLRLGLKHFDSTVTPISCNSGAICEEYERFARKTRSSPRKVADINQWVLKETKKDMGNFHMRTIIGLEQSEKASFTAMFNNQPYHGPPIALNYLTNALLRTFNGGHGQIIAHNHPLPHMLTAKDVEESVGGNMEGFSVGLWIVFGIGFLVSGFVVFLIKERVSNAKHLQFVSGANLWVFWTGNFILDYCYYVSPCVLMVAVIFAFQIESFKDFEVLVLVFILLLLHGWAMIPLMYLCSFMFSAPSTGYTRMSIANVITGMATVITVSILKIPPLKLMDIALILDWVFMLCPSYNLGWGIASLGRNFGLKKDCKGIPAAACSLKESDFPCCTEYQRPDGYGYADWHIPGIGRNILFLIVEGFLFLALVMLWDSGIFKCRKPSNQPKVAAAQTRRNSTDESDVALEATRILNTPLTQLFVTDNLVVLNLHKKYKKFVAVKSLSFGVQPKECFGLLGVNGAGKTTTFKMLTGDIVPTSGDAFVHGHSVNSEIKQVQKNLGYCPQFDALIEELTGREMIRLFARLRGVREDQINGLVNQLGEGLLFSEHMEKRCGTYSGGNKRKLSTAIALVGNPPIIFLDEPTTGMDPVARRHLWNCISNVRQRGTSIVLTSHSMEECEALCTRLAIMVKGQFRCIGSTQHLKSKYGNGYTVIAQMPRLARKVSREVVVGTTESVKSSNDEWTSQLKPLKQFIQESFPGCDLKDEHPGYVHYQVETPDLKWSELFKKMEAAKEQFQLEAYSVGQATLEQVFLSFAKDQDPDA